MSKILIIAEHDGGKLNASTMMPGTGWLAMILDLLFMRQPPQR